MADKPLPPREKRFRPGISGNPKGRPKGSKNKRTKVRTPALHQTVRYRVDGVWRRMTRREAIVRFAQAQALEPNNADLATLLLQADQKLSAAQAQVDYTERWVHGPNRSPTIRNVEEIVTKLGLGRLIYPDHPAQRVALEPELVSLALSRLEEPLTRDEQKLVVAFTLNPRKVNWPCWWDGHLGKKCRLPARFLAEEEAEWRRALTPAPKAPNSTEPLRYLDLEAEYAKEPKWVCKTTHRPQLSPCDACILQRKGTSRECRQSE